MEKKRPHETCSLPYGAAANIHEEKLCSAGKIVQKKPAVILVEERATLKRIPFRLFVRTIHQFI